MLTKEFLNMSHTKTSEVKVRLIKMGNGRYLTEYTNIVIKVSIDGFEAIGFWNEKTKSEKNKSSMNVFMIVVFKKFLLIYLKVIVDLF